MTGFSNPLVGGGGALVYPSIHSPDYVPAQAGWSLNKDGTAQLNGLIITGGLSLFYAGTPAAGTLALSVAAEAGTDEFGNAYLPGTVSYQVFDPTAFAMANSGGRVTLYHAASQAGPYTEIGQVGAYGAGDGLNLFIGSSETAGVFVDQGFLAAQDPASAGAFPAEWQQFSQPLGGGFTPGADVNGTTYNPAYKLLPDGRLALRGELVAPATGAVTGVTFGTVPAGYAPALNVATAAVVNNTGAQAGAVYVRPDGNVQLSGAFINGAQIRLDCTIGVAGA